MSQLTPVEHEVVHALAEAWNRFLALPAIHPCDRPEFLAVIHQAQHMVLSRPARRELTLQTTQLVNTDDANR